MSVPYLLQEELSRARIREFQEAAEADRQRREARGQRVVVRRLRITAAASRIVLAAGRKTQPDAG